jgi:hypothetical protein
MGWIDGLLAWFKAREDIDWDTAGGLTGSVGVSDLVSSREGQAGMPSHAVRPSQWERGWY